MKVAASALALSASSSRTEVSRVETYMKSQKFIFEKDLYPQAMAKPEVAISPEAQKKAEQAPKEAASSAMPQDTALASTARNEEINPLRNKESVRLQFLVSLLEKVFGITIHLLDNKEILSKDKEDEAKAMGEALTNEKREQEASARDSFEASRIRRPSLGALFEVQEYGERHVYQESEHSAFFAEGMVQTVDGKKLSFSMSLTMSYEYYEESTLERSKIISRKIDPLVVNFAGTSAELTDTRFSFDLNADGKDDNINFAKGGSGFLVFDRNGDGNINDGKELFGALSGNGFADLAAFDEDKNGWIDENDSVFQKLSLWQKDEKGNDRFLSLKEADVGAFYLDAMNTPYTVRKENREEMAAIRQTGLSLHESNFVAGSVQQIDLIV